MLQHFFYFGTKVHEFPDTTKFGKIDFEAGNTNSDLRELPNAIAKPNVILIS